MLLALPSAISSSARILLWLFAFAPLQHVSTTKRVQLLRLFGALPDSKPWHLRPLSARLADWNYPGKRSPALAIPVVRFLEQSPNQRGRLWSHCATRPKFTKVLPITLPVHVEPRGSGLETLSHRLPLCL